MNKSSYLFRFLWLFFGLFIGGTGCYVTIQANIGLGAWESLNMGFSYVTGFSYGNASIVLGIGILLLDLLIKEKIGFGTIINTFVFSKWVDVWNYFDVLPQMNSLLTGVPVMLIGQVLISIGTWMYMSMAMGSGPRDSLMVGLGKRFSGLPIGVVRISLETFALLLGWLMGAKVGVGTVIGIFGLGFVMQGVFAVVGFEARAVKHENCIDTLKLLKERRLSSNNRS